MTTRRLPLALASMALLFLTGCEKPAPQITVASNGRVINVDASRYCRKECRDHGATQRDLKVRGDTTVSFDVPKRVAERGWLLQIGEQQLFAAPRKESHYTLTIPALREQALPVTIHEGAGADPSGIWKIQLLVKE